MKITAFIYYFLERQQSIAISSPSTELVSNPLEVIEDNIRKSKFQTTSVGSEEEKKKLIQKEAVQIGSVSFSLFITIIISLN